VNDKVPFHVRRRAAAQLGLGLMTTADYVRKGARLASLLCLESCVAYPTMRTFYEPTPDDGTYPSACGYVATHNVIERTVNGARFRIVVGSHDREPTERTPTLDVHIQVIYQGDDVALDPTKVAISADGVNAEIHGTLLHPPGFQVAEGFQRQAGQMFHTLSFDIRYPAPAGMLDALSVTFASGAMQVNGDAQVVQDFRFRRVTKHDFIYQSINC
jgi:hypothetical protein